MILSYFNNIYVIIKLSMFQGSYNFYYSKVTALQIFKFDHQDLI